MNPSFTPNFHELNQTKIELFLRLAATDIK